MLQPSKLKCGLILDLTERKDVKKRGKQKKAMLMTSCAMLYSNTEAKPFIYVHIWPRTMHHTMATRKEWMLNQLWVGVFTSAKGGGFPSLNGCYQNNAANSRVDLQRPPPSRCCGKQSLPQHDRNNRA